MASETNQVRDASASQISVDAEDQFMYGIAQELNKKGIWNRQLPRHEYMIVEAALKSVQAWKEFFEITLDLESKNKNNNSTSAKAASKSASSKKKRPKKSSTSSSKKRTNNKKGQKKDDETELDNEKSNDAPVTDERTDKTEDDDAGRYVEILKFRVRSIVFDYIASKHLFDSQSTEDHNPAEDIFVTYDELLDDDDHLLQEEDEDDEDAEPVPAFKIEIAGNKVPQEKKNVNANRELRSLMPDVKQSTTKKWELTSSEELKDLYAGMERVLHELKNYKEHSYPFLKKVSKSEAPDYHEVISNPMDLATMTKNLHNLHYWSKAEFQSDLDLMYANCRKYNTEPEGKMYLEHADAMEKRTTELMKTVKDYDVSADKERLLEEVKKREGQREERKSDDMPNKRRTEVKQRIQFYHEHPYVTHKRSQKSAQDPVTELPSAAQLAEVQHKDYIELLLSGVDALELTAPAEEDADLSKMLQRITAQHQQLFNRADPAIRPGKLDPVLNEQGTELEHVSVALNEELSKQIVKQSIAVILNQNNIGGCEHQALDVLTDVLEDFMLHIGRVARSYLDLPGSEMSSLDASVKAVSDLAGECTDGIREWLLEKKRDESRALREALIEEGSRQALHREMTPFIAFTRKSKPAPQLSNHHIGFYQHQQQAQQALQQQQQQAQNQLQQLQQQQAQMQQTQGLTQHQLLQLQMQQRTRMQQPQMHPQMQGAQVKKEGMPPQGAPQRFPPTGPPDMTNPHAPRINSFPPNLPHNPAGTPGADNALRRSAKRRKGEGGEPIPVGPTIPSPETDARRVRPTRGRRSYPEEDYLDDSQLRHLDEMDKPGHGAPEMPAHHIPASYPPHAAAPEMMQPMNAMTYQPPPGAQVPVGRGRGAPPMNRPVPITNPPPMPPQPVAMPPQPMPEEDPNAKRGKRTPRGRGKK